MLLQTKSILMDDTLGKSHYTDGKKEAETGPRSNTLPNKKWIGLT